MKKIIFTTFFIVLMAAPMFAFASDQFNSKQCYPAIQCKEPPEHAYGTPVKCRQIIASKEDCTSINIDYNRFSCEKGCYTVTASPSAPAKAPTCPVVTLSGTNTIVPALTWVRDGDIGRIVECTTGMMHEAFNGLWVNGVSGSVIAGESTNVVSTVNPSFAMGRSNSVLGWFSTAMGIGNTVNGDYSLAIGHNNTSNGQGSVALGMSNVSNTQSTVALGNTSEATGLYAVAIGLRAIANASHSKSIGYETKATGSYSTAMGVNTEAQAYGSTVLGQYNTISTVAGAPNPTTWIDNDPLFVIGNGKTNLTRSNAMTILKNGNVGIGTATPKAMLDVEVSDASGGAASLGSYFNEASGDFSVAMGYFAKATNHSAIAMGRVTVASGSSSTAMGLNTEASGDYSVAMGHGSKATGEHSTAMGVETEASGDYAVAIGGRTKAESHNSLVIGQYNITNPGYSRTGWFEGDPLFVIGNGTATIPSNALTVLKNGNVGIGTATPSYPLHAVTTSSDGRGVFGSATHQTGTNYGVYGSSSSTSGHGVYGNAAASSGTNYGVYGMSGSASGFGVYGRGSNSARYGYLGGPSMGGYAQFDNNNYVQLGTMTRGLTAVGSSTGVYGQGGTIGIQGYAQTSNNSAANGGYFSAHTSGAGNARAGYFTASTTGTGTAYGVYIAAGDAAKPGGGAWSNASDERLKDVEGNYEKGLKEIIQLEPVSFHYKKDNPLDLPSDEQYVGFIAQAVQKVFPKAVKSDANGYLDFNMHSVNVAVINAIKELKSEKDADVAELKAETEVLRAEVDALKAEIQELKSLFAN